MMNLVASVLNKLLVAGVTDEGNAQSLVTVARIVCVNAFIHPIVNK